MTSKELKVVSPSMSCRWSRVMIFDGFIPFIVPSVSTAFVTIEEII
jgi:hypothetical protein